MLKHKRIVYSKVEKSIKYIGAFAELNLNEVVGIWSNSAPRKYEKVLLPSSPQLSEHSTAE